LVGHHRRQFGRFPLAAIPLDEVAFACVIAYCSVTCMLSVTTSVGQPALFLSMGVAVMVNPTFPFTTTVKR
jgi:hypothetical protein